uniref:DUF1285 domain-containing protein n=1 Tax=Ningiella ruwaisensis TaxID=2364274 RepID=UPI0010A00B82|nr:DUF1285 domain-containing protein [Ningiella ruwaisensis]
MDLKAIQQSIEDSTDTGAKSRSLPPVEKWDPEFCGNMNLVIKRNGQWWHEGTPFTREALVKLFASVIKKENEDYFLVTPVEKIGITVEDVPFVIIDHKKTDSGIEVITQTGDRFTLSDAHPVELRKFEESLVPYCNVRRNLWARVHQNVLYRWVEAAQEVDESASTENTDSNKNKAAKYSKALYLQSGHYRFCIGRF